jgi:hypothetical protein
VWVLNVACRWSGVECFGSVLDESGYRIAAERSFMASAPLRTNIPPARPKSLTCTSPPTATTTPICTTSLCLLSDDHSRNYSNSSAN